MRKMLKTIPSKIMCMTCTHADEISKRRIYYPNYEETEHVDYRDVIDNVECNMYGEQVSPAVSCEHYDGILNHNIERERNDGSITGDELAEPDELLCVNCNNDCGFATFEIDMFNPTEMRIRDIYCSECENCDTPPCVRCTRYRPSSQHQTDNCRSDDDRKTDYSEDK